MYCYSNVHHQLGIHLLLIKNMVTGTFLLKKMANKTLYQQMRKYKKEIFQISIYFKISPAFVQPAKIRQLRSRRAIKYRFQAGIFIL